MADLESGASPLVTSPTIIEMGALLKPLFLLYCQYIAAFLFTLLLIVFVFIMNLPSYPEFIRFPFFLFLNFLFTFLITYQFVFLLERFAASRWTKAFYFLFDMKITLFCFIYSTSNYGYWVAYTRSTSIIGHQYQLYVDSTLATLVAATLIWTLKILGLKLLACTFHAHNYFEKMEHLIYDDYLLQTLLSGTTIIKFHIISGAVHKPFDQTELDTLFSRVMTKFTHGDNRDIQETDLLGFMWKEDVAQLLKLLQANDTKTITQPSLKKFIDTICKNREDLVHLLTHTCAAIKDLNHIINMSMLPILIPLWFLFMEFGTRVVLTVTGLSWTLLALCIPVTKFPEGVISAFWKRPFDIGDYCIIDNQEIVVQDLGIFETNFSDHTSHTITFSSVLATKSIKNITRSSVWSETFEFSVKAPRNLDKKIKRFELKLDEFLKNKPKIWSEGHSLFFENIAAGGSKYALKVTHSTKFQNLELNKVQRSELMFAVRRYFELVGIECLSLNSVI